VLIKILKNLLKKPPPKMAVFYFLSKEYLMEDFELKALLAANRVVLDIEERRPLEEIALFLGLTSGDTPITQHEKEIVEDER
jgi:hypothetical protein